MSHLALQTFELQDVELPDHQHDSVILVCLLGTFRLLWRGKPGDIFISGKALTLLSLLALHLELGVPRESLLNILWPDQDAKHANVSLNNLVYTLQRRLRDKSDRAPALVFAAGSYYLNRVSGITTDIASFDALVSHGDRFVRTGDIAQAVTCYTQAVALYRGDLCFDSDVASIVERERLRATFLTILCWLADHAYQSAQYETALQYALRLLSCDPCREDGYRLAMRAYVRRGERAQALRQYQLCEHVLRREFDTAPEPLTTELFERIRASPAGV
jgi:LuxR family transcriptional regulator, maltose regulon positive regulatory protein